MQTNKFSERLLQKLIFLFAKSSDKNCDRWKKVSFHHRRNKIAKCGASVTNALRRREAGWGQPWPISYSVNPDHIWVKFALIIVMDDDFGDFIFKIQSKKMQIINTRRRIFFQGTVPPLFNYFVWSSRIDERETHERTDGRIATHSHPCTMRK